MLEAIHKADVHPALIYAYQKTGRPVTRENRKNLTKAEFKECNDASMSVSDEQLTGNLMSLR